MIDFGSLTLEEALSGEHLANRQFVGRNQGGNGVALWASMTDRPIVALVFSTYGGPYAVVFLTGPVGGTPFFPEERMILEFLPEGPGYWWVDETGMHPAGFWLHRGGIFRRLSCALGLHRRRRVEGYWFEVEQCPHCLEARINRVPQIGLDTPRGAEGSFVLVANFTRLIPLPQGSWV